jgi:hypothetical protein
MSVQRMSAGTGSENTASSTFRCLLPKPTTASYCVPDDRRHERIVSHLDIGVSSLSYEVLTCLDGPSRRCIQLAVTAWPRRM